MGAGGKILQFNCKSNFWAIDHMFGIIILNQIQSSRNLAKTRIFIMPNMCASKMNQ